MGQVGKFIDSMCAEHPALMRAVLNRPFSRLGEWIDWDAEGGACGCLIGTTALVAGVSESEGTREPCEFLANTLGRDGGEIMAVGLLVYDISVRLAHGTIHHNHIVSGTHESDQRVIHLIRTRIAVALLVGERVGVPV